MRKLSMLMMAATLLIGGHVYADDDVVEQKLNLKNHIFVPQTMTVPQGRKVKLIITNEDSTPAEFESFELHREKVVAPQDSIIVYVGPLDPGTYPFFDDFHHDTTIGSIISK